MNRGLLVVLLNALMRTEHGDWPAMPEPVAVSTAREASQQSPFGGQASAASNDVVAGGADGGMVETESHRSVALPGADGNVEEADGGAFVGVLAQGAQAAQAALDSASSGDEEVIAAVDVDDISDHLRTLGSDGLPAAGVTR